MITELPSDEAGIDAPATARDQAKTHGLRRCLSARCRFARTRSTQRTRELLQEWEAARRQNSKLSGGASSRESEVVLQAAAQTMCLHPNSEAPAPCSATPPLANSSCDSHAYHE